MNEKKLLELKKDIEKAKNEVNQLEGRKKYLFQQLEKDWSCKTIKQAKKKLQDLKKQIKQHEEKIEERLTDLEEKYEFEEN